MVAKRTILVGIGFLVSPTAAHANAIIPYFWVPIAQLFLFPVVVLVETWVVNYRLGKGYWRSSWRVLVANIVSTVIGAILYFSLMPYIGKPFWDIWIAYKTPAAIGLSFIIAFILFLVSWGSEYLVAKRLFSDIPKQELSKSFLYANISTYVALWFLSVLDA